MLNYIFSEEGYAYVLVVVHGFNTHCNPVQRGCRILPSVTRLYTAHSPILTLIQPS